MLGLFLAHHIMQLQQYLFPPYSNGGFYAHHKADSLTYPVGYMMHPQQHPSPMQQGMEQMQGGMHPPPGAMQGPPGGLQGPLAYLERTMSSIGNVCKNMPNSERVDNFVFG
ncbi:hypothetical protein JTE90_029388 [Oedothorax gibbosus]|uniref:Uncharacterized protein n=1 Tax=Oedothorax gibbosus TaxID=931172 RepID=A0AAV6VQ33_9ARAC|nr:hypothetical protein JTE90_029388 [Oedothorax gibbosus]